MAARHPHRLPLLVLFLVLLSACDSSTKVNTPPVANAGPDLSADVGAVVHLNGTGSDADGDNLSYSWAFVSRPAGSAASLSGATTTSASFTPDVGGQYVLSFTVSDGKDSGSDECTISANTSPIANAGPDQEVALGVLVQLSGDGSSDPDGDNLSYSWAFVSRPAGSAATLSSTVVTNPTFTADVEGTFVVGLVVSDGTASSAQDLVTITVTQAQTPLYLNYISSERALSNQQVASGTIRLTLYGSGNAVDFPANLGSSLNGTNYGFSIWLGSGTGSGQTGTWVATILIEHSGVETTLATHTFSVPYNSNFVEYTATATGMPGGAAGDQIILRLTMTDVSQGGILFGESPVDSHILVPGTVTVSQVTSPPGVSAEEETGVKVEVRAASDLKYRGG